jgi:diacylglycerol kinase
MTDPRESSHWIRKFGNACRGIKRGVRGESSFFVHFFIALCVVIAAAVLKLELASWCLLVLCIGSVMAAEMFNSALEHLAKAVTSDDHPEIRDALDISSGAVLVASVSATIVGALIFVPRLLPLFQ